MKHKLNKKTQSLLMLKVIANKPQVKMKNQSKSILAHYFQIEWKISITFQRLRTIGDKQE